MLSGTRWALYMSNIGTADLKDIEMCFITLPLQSFRAESNKQFIHILIVDYAKSGQGLCFKCLISMPCTVTNHIHPQEIMKNISSNSTYLKTLIFITSSVSNQDKIFLFIIL